MSKRRVAPPAPPAPSGPSPEVLVAILHPFINRDETPAQALTRILAERDALQIRLAGRFIP